jgi:hypothetical protein
MSKNCSFVFKICYIFISSTFLISLIVCTGRTPEKKPWPSLSLEALKNATYQYQWDGGRVELAQLADGEYRERSNISPAYDMVVKMTDIHTFGDLDADGSQDAVVILTENAGGSGTWLFLAPMLNQKGSPMSVTAQSLGDRVKINAVSIHNGVIIVDMITHGPNDGLCCPTVPVIRRYKLDGNTLVRLSDGD